MTAERCYACDRMLGCNPARVMNEDSQIVFVGLECWKRVLEAGAMGYQPPKGGPRLYPMPGVTSEERRNGS